MEPKKPRVTDAEFEIVRPGSRRQATWGEQTAADFSELNWIGKIIAVALIVGGMSVVYWVATTLVNLIWP